MTVQLLNHQLVGGGWKMGNDQNPKLCAYGLFLVWVLRSYFSSFCCNLTVRLMTATDENNQRIIAYVISFFYATNSSLKYLQVHYLHTPCLFL